MRVYTGWLQELFWNLVVLLIPRYAPQKRASGKAPTMNTETVYDEVYYVACVACDVSGTSQLCVVIVPLEMKQRGERKDGKTEKVDEALKVKSRQAKASTR